jgi:hypothetical protein
MPKSKMLQVVSTYRFSEERLALRPAFRAQTKSNRRSFDSVGSKERTQLRSG